jgi:ribosome-associated toxin RatA of RatAB toxin-antitoxin module
MRNEIAIDAPAQRIFERAGATESWPQMLPHYRYVRVLEKSGDRRIIEMAARRPIGNPRVGIPVRWRAEQTNDASIPQIAFRHLSGWTKGMRVYWRFLPLSSGGTLVQIDHEFDSPLAPIIGAWFIDPIATRTLKTIKRICESNAP